ncbi:MAG TPA: hypothetical protein VFM46_02485 [Pseudomonadales bacterium]|nr:hypothetical protein [Pseudomonadales bacterium]
MSADHHTMCPSAQPDWEGAKVFGVVGGTADAPETAYLAAPVPVTSQLIALAQPVEPAEVFRFAAPCACSGCGHYSAEQSSCKLAEKTVRWVEPVTQRLPVCGIRAECRWWQQEGREACMRCPQVVTHHFTPSDAMRDAANQELA